MENEKRLEEIEWFNKARPLTHEETDWLINQAAKANMFRDTLNYIAGNSHLTTDTLQESRDAANGVLEEAGE